MEDLTLNDLLTADTHGENILIVDDAAEDPYPLIPDRKTFFSAGGPFAKVEEDGLVLLQNEKNECISLDHLFERLRNPSSSYVVLIEGFAGCGKSTLVQFILSQQLKTFNYDYSFYNYDLEMQNDLIRYDASGRIVRRSSIFSAIKKSFFEQFIKIAKCHKNVINDFANLLRLCKDYNRFFDLFLYFRNTKTFESILTYVNTDVDAYEDMILNLLSSQAESISNSICLLALDYIFRLAMYNNKLLDNLYICYDNLDAIEDADDLRNFDNILVSFRKEIDQFIKYLRKMNAISNRETPHFVIMATYRKISASLANLSANYQEVMEDNKAGRETNNEHTTCVYHIDATAAFSYKQIVTSRKRYFENVLLSAPNISETTKQRLLNDFSSWEKLNNSISIMTDRYANLWNRNYRTCSFIADTLYSDPKYNFSKIVSFIENSKIHDGYEGLNIDDESNVLCSYYGSSAIMLSSICKVFNNNKIWDEFLKLSQLNSTSVSYKNVSLSRLVMTYMYNCNRAVSLQELVSEFCGKGMFSYRDLCNILSKMLARNRDGVWRRPIYYAQECILSEDASIIADELYNECRYFHDTNSSQHDYKFLLCDSGKAYVERLMQEFEFFSNRLSNNNMCLYLYHSVDDISSVIKCVLEAVSKCCNNMLDFKRAYINSHKSRKNKYLTLPFHPTTVNHSSQLHSERIIFSHIAYLNNVRLYYLDERTTPDLDNRKMFNKMFVEHINEYLELYKKKILPICVRRQKVATELSEIVRTIQKAIDGGSEDLEIIFQSISISKTPENSAN